MTIMGRKPIRADLTNGDVSGAKRFAPLTPAQAALLLQSELSGNPSLNVIQIVARFEGEAINPLHMKLAWQAMADRHPALRLLMHIDAEFGPQQSVATSVAVRMQKLDWSDRSATAQEASLTDWLAADKHTGTPVETVPNWRVAWICLGARRSVMIWTFHHAILDGTSFRLVLKDLFAEYESRAQRRTSALPPQPAQPDFLDHCDAVARQDKSAATAHFSALLSGFDTPNTLPEAFSRGASGTAAERRFINDTLTAAQSRAVHERAKLAGATAANLIAAAWGLVLARVTGRDGAVFGLTRSGRHLLPGAGQIAGCLINTLPARLNLGIDKTVDAVLAEMRAQTIAAQPFETIAAADVIEGSAQSSDRAWFDSIVMFDRGSLAVQMRAQGPEWHTRMITEHSHIGTSITIAAYDDPEMLIQFEYDPSRLSDTGAKRLAAYLHAVILGVATARPDALLRDIDMLPATERSALIALGLPDYPTAADAGASGVVAQFEATAGRHPDRIAVSQIGVPGALTFAQLNSRADQIAAQLQQRGVVAGDAIGLELPRGAPYIAAMLGVLKAGASFVPVDPTYPAAVRSDMVNRSGLVCLICDGATTQDVEHPDVPMLNLMHDLSAVPIAVSPVSPVIHDAARRAYVIFTSGSSGQPKGVEVSHNALAHHAAAAIDTYALTPQDRVLQFTSQSFDISIEEIVPTLLAGAHLVLRNDQVVQSGHDFVAALAAEQITVMNLPTAFWHTLAEHLEDTGPAALPGSLRLVVAGGERVSPAVLARWRALFPGLRWLNGYGPTETTITATTYDPGIEGFDGGDVPIGRPFGHARAYVACVDGSLAPFGVDGELWVGGPAVAMGYLAREDLTRAAFLPDRFAPEGGCVKDLPQRIYRTGDRVAWRSDGNLRYSGRLDRQVKLRGYRIEPAAIEAALESHPAVAAAVVAVDHADDAHAQLLAWVCPRSAMRASLNVSELQRSLIAHLPAHMLPVIQIVPDLPQTPGGKIDVARLPRPTLRRPSAAPAHADADTRKVQTIFARLLNVPRVDPDVSFFDLGGHSLLSVRLMSLIQRDFGQRLTLAALYAHPTARGLAKELARLADTTEVSSCLVPIQPAGNGPPLFMVHVLGPDAAYIKPLAAQLGRHRPVFGVTIDLFDPATPTTIPEIAAIYCANIQRHYPNGPICLAAVSNGAYMALELAQQLVAAGRNVAGLYFMDASGPGGRPQKARQANLAGYASRLINNFGGVVRGRSEHAWMTLRFKVEKLRLRLFSGRQMTVPATLSAADLSHQAKLALLIDAYKPAPYRGLITVFRSKEQIHDSKAAIASGLGWAPVAAVGFEVIDVPGYHLTTLQDPNVHVLARIIGRKMHAIEASWSIKTLGGIGRRGRRRDDLQLRSSDSTEFSKMRPWSVTLKQSS